MVKIGFYVPASHLEQVKNAVFDAGAGRIGTYDRCCWQCLGRGQFRPGDYSQPFLGKQNELESVDEYRVELVCEDALASGAISALKAAHPYETPAYDVSVLLDL